jgi:hypothetical protein
MVSTGPAGQSKRIAFLEQHVFRGGEVGYPEVNLLVALDEPIPEPALPAGCQVRPLAEVGEISKLSAAQREVFNCGRSVKSATTIKAA